tara:strand:- start:46 stop:465 length:420 start_codon:yes stop_codon:yes gene_type:complete
VTKKKNISQEDIDTWKNYIKNPTGIVDKEAVQKVNTSNNHRFIFDLHGFTLVEANNKVKEIILSCIKKNYKEILFITGKGIHSDTEKNVYISKDLSKLKNSVPAFIKSELDLSKHIFSISNADLSDGGDGAIIVKLKKL